MTVRVMCRSPLENDTGYGTFILEAVDSGGKSVRESIKIHIHQPKEARNYLHKSVQIICYAFIYLTLCNN